MLFNTLLVLKKKNTCYLQGYKFHKTENLTKNMKLKKLTIIVI